MRIPYYVVDAFTNRAFGGNPAGVCVLDEWLPDTTLQQIAAENNLSETAFLKRKGDEFQLRWFTPLTEVDLCGHATLASAFVLFSERRYGAERVRFETKSGWLAAHLRGSRVELDFPARPPVPCAAPADLARGLGREPLEVLRSRDYLAVFDSETAVAGLAPDFAALARLDSLGVIATAPGKEADFVSRFFAPRVGVPEDPVTGSAHCSLIPFWAERLGKAELFARQISRRGGELRCRHAGERVVIGGESVVYCRGELEVPALDSAQSASAAQFDRQSERYGKSHILADTRDVAHGLSGIPGPAGGAALDVATGGGHTALFLARQGWEVTAGDISHRMLENARKLCHEAGFSIQTRSFPAEEMPFPGGTFDLVTVRVAPHHFSSPERFVRETARVLKPGGHFLVIDGTVPDDDPETEEWLHRVEKWHDPSHGRLLPRRTWEGLVGAAGLRVVRSELHPMKQPDVQWWFDTSATPEENRGKVLEAVREASAHVRQALRLGTEDGKIVWWWPRLTLLAAKPALVPASLQASSTSR